MTQTILHPMVKLQRKVQSLVEAKILQPTDSLWKIAFLYGDQWSFWKEELADFGFSTQDTVEELLLVEAWEEPEEDAA